MLYLEVLSLLALLVQKYKYGRLRGAGRCARSRGRARVVIMLLTKPLYDAAN